MLFASGPLVVGHHDANGNFVLRADHAQIVRFLGGIAARFKVDIRWYGTGSVSTVAEAHTGYRWVRLDSAWADHLVVLHGHSAVVFVLLHEVGHLNHGEARGKRGERLADAFAAATMRQLGYRPEEVVRAASVTLAGTPDDGVHDAGSVRLAAIARQVMPRRGRARRGVWSLFQQQ